MAAADAITDVLPPARASGPPPSAQKDDGPSFDDHLAQADGADKPVRPDRPDRPERTEQKARDDDKDKDNEDTSTAAAQTPPVAPKTPASPLLTLALAQDGDHNADGADTKAADAQTTAPIAPPPGAPNPQADVKAKGNTGKSAPAQKSSDANTAPSTDANSDATPTQSASDATTTAAAASANDAAIATAAANAPVVAAAPQQTQAPAHKAQDRSSADAAPTITQLANGAAKPETPRPVTPKESSAKTSDEPKAQSTTDKFAALLALAQDDKGANTAAPTAALAPQASAPRAEPTAAPVAATHAPVSTQINHEIVRKFSGGNTKFEMRLDPPELGRVEVKLEVSRDHKVTATISADSPAALRELSRNARDLEQSLQSSGLDLAEDGLSFNLSDRQNTNPDQANQSNARATSERASAFASTKDETTATTTARPLSIDGWRGVRIDLVA